VKKIVLGVVGTVIYYLLTVVTLFVMTLLFRDSFENIWISAIPVTIVAEIILLGCYFSWKKYKKLQASRR
jgi:positive regulator of sigma E activity